MPLAVSADELRVVGFTTLPLENQESFLWTPKEGMRSIEECLGNIPLFETWKTDKVTSITPNGAVLIGTAKRKDSPDFVRAWRAVIPTNNLF